MKLGVRANQSQQCVSVECIFKLPWGRITQLSIGDMGDGRPVLGILSASATVTDSAGANLRVRQIIHAPQSAASSDL